jgi:hypothetical protein
MLSLNDKNLYPANDCKKFLRRGPYSYLDNSDTRPRRSRWQQLHRLKLLLTQIAQIALNL